ncbi:MAG: sulfatase-like hydrolase/transferase [Halanaerobiales bacterium]
MSKLPNIIYILADDMGYGDVEAFNSDSKIPTPNMNQLAREGISFTDAHSSSAVCTPSRYSIMTGRYCWRTDLKEGVLHGFGSPLIDSDRMTVPSLLKEKGYATAAFGKWHLGFDWKLENGNSVKDEYDMIGNIDGFDIDYSRELRGGPVDCGFDRYFGISASLDMPPYCFIENDHTVGIPDREKEVYYNQQRKGLQVPDWQDNKVDMTFAEKAVEFIEEQSQKNPEQPFFLYLPTAGPHRPNDIRPDFIKGKSDAGDRGDMVVLFDWIVGQVMDALERMNIKENTLLIVTSDNGPRATCANGRDYGHNSSGGWRGQKADIWEGGHREPFIARWLEQIEPGTTSDETTCLSDLMATCAAIVEKNLPDNTAEDSYNILPALLGEELEEPIREDTVHHSLIGYFSLRKGEWKLIDRLGSGGFTEPQKVEPGPDDPEGQLYNLEEDPEETNNLYQEKPEVVEHLHRLLEKEKEKDQDN